MQPSSLSKIMCRWTDRLGLEGKPLTARVLRRAYATDMATDTPLRIVMDQLGHSNLSTTQKYLGVDEAAALAAAERRSARRRGG